MVRRYLLPIAAGLALLVVLAPAGCGPPEPTLNVLNWSDYIAPELLEEFEQQHGVRVQYDNYASDGELESKMQAGARYDVIFPSDRSMVPLVKKGLLAELDRSLLPNWVYLDKEFLGRRFDPENTYSVPYFWGTLAVGVRTDRVAEELKGFEALFDERCKGRITMLNEAENAVAVALLHLDLPMNSTKDEDLARAKELLQKQRRLVQAYTSSKYREKLISGEAWVALGWSGDLLQAREKESNIAVIVPEKGTMKWVDSMAIPKTAANPKLAHAFLNFLMGPEVAARNANFVRYATPNAGARAKLDRELLDDPAVYPSPEVMARCEWLQDRGPDIAKIERLWREVRR